MITAIADLLDAAAFAADRHRDQRRKDADASPYINHPLEVAAVLARHGVVDPLPLLAAILHDTIEDTETTADELRERFGDAVTAVVLEVSDDKSLPKAERKALQVEHAPALSPAAKLVKLADKIANVRDVGANPPAAWSVERRRAYLEWTERVVAGCLGSHMGLEATYAAALEKAREHIDS